MPVTRRELDQAQCGVPGCDHKHHDNVLYLHAACHPRSKLNVAYMGDGRLRLECGHCGLGVMEVLVAEHGHA